MAHFILEGLWSAQDTKLPDRNPIRIPLTLHILGAVRMSSDPDPEISSRKEVGEGSIKSVYIHPLRTQIEVFGKRKIGKDMNSTVRVFGFLILLVAVFGSSKNKPHDHQGTLEVNTFCALVDTVSFLSHPQSTCSLCRHLRMFSQNNNTNDHTPHHTTPHQTKKQKNKKAIHWEANSLEGDFRSEFQVRQR